MTKKQTNQPPKISNAVKAEFVHQIFVATLEQYFKVEIHDCVGKIDQEVRIVFRSPGHESYFVPRGRRFFADINGIFDKPEADLVFQKLLQESLHKLIEDIVIK